MRRPHIPRDWSAEQALAVAEFLEAILEDVWSVHGATLEQALALRADPDLDPEADDTDEPDRHAGSGSPISDASR